jgi:hypothetical protein
MAAGQLALMLNAMPLSRAGSHWGMVLIHQIADKQKRPA